MHSTFLFPVRHGQGRHFGAPFTAGNVPQGGLHGRLDGGLSCRHPLVHGDGSVPVHHISADSDRRRKGEEDQGGHEDHGVEGLSILVRQR